MGLLKNINNFLDGVSPFSRRWRSLWNEMAEVCYRTQRMYGDNGIVVSQSSKGIKVAYLPPSPRIASDGFWAKIGTNAADGTNAWKYAFKEQTKATAGYGGWADLSGGRTGTTGTGPARNTIEDMNDGSGVQGNGVSVANLTGGCAIKPCPSGAIVWMRFVPVADGTVEPWFEYENGVDL